MKLRGFLFILVFGCSVGFALDCHAHPNPFRTTIKGQVYRLLSASPGETVRISFSVRNGGVHRFILKRMPRQNALELRDQQLIPANQTVKPILFQGKRRLRANDQSRPSGWVPVGVAVDVIEDFLTIHFHTRGGRFITRVESKLVDSAISSVKARVRYLTSHKDFECLNSRFGAAAGAQAAQTYCDDRSEIQPGQGSCKSGYVSSPERVVSISTDADAAWYGIYGINTNAKIQSILNAAEAIYMRDLGISFRLDTQNYFTSETVYTSSNYALLLNQFTNYGNSAQHLGDAVIKHLFTGKTISSGVIGYAWLDVACNDPEFSYGFTQSVAENIQPLVTAHEIGHNFGATHTDPDGVYATTLMSPIVKAQNTYFSTCSLCEIKIHNDAYGSCLESDFGVSSARLRSRRAQRRARLSMDLGFPPNSSGCELTLYARRRKSQLFPDITSKAKVIYQRQLSADQSLALRASIKNGNATRRNRIWLRANLSCDGKDDQLSSTKAIRGYLRTTRLIERLKRSLNRQ